MSIKVCKGGRTWRSSRSPSRRDAQHWSFFIGLSFKLDKAGRVLHPILTSSRPQTQDQPAAVKHRHKTHTTLLVNGHLVLGWLSFETINNQNTIHYDS